MYAAPGDGSEVRRVASLLFLTQRIPYPPTKGEKIRSLQILRHFALDYEVHLGTIIDDPDDWQHVETVRALCRDAYFGSIDRRVAKVTCLAGLLTGEPLSVRFFHDRGLRAWVNRTLETVRPDVVFVCSGNMAPYVLEHRHHGRVRIVDVVDVDSEKWREYAAKAGVVMRWVYEREARLTRALERRIARESEATTFVTDAEADLFRAIAPDSDARIHGVSNGVDYVYFDPALIAAPVYDTSEPNFVFTGTMDYPPNVDAVCWFAREILPLIRADLPSARFHVVGSSPSAEVVRLAQIENVFVTGRVADVRPYVAHATACVAPLRIARGIQNKVLEAMAMARAVIVTPDALEGIAAEPGEELELAADAPSFAAAAIGLARHPERAARMGAAARRRIEARYSWAAQLSAFDTIIAAPRSGVAAD
jgi:sugar transferase (PEP-CTERM/EpsH1 system associated)